MGAAEQAVNTTLIYYHLIHTVVMATFTYLHIQQTQSNIIYIWSRVSGHLMNVILIFTLLFVSEGNVWLFGSGQIVYSGCIRAFLWK